MTRARRISEGERTHAERQLDGEIGDLIYDGDTVVGHTIDTSEPQVGEPREQPERLCKRCEAVADPNTAYGLVISSTGLGHYTADAGTTLCGADTSTMRTA